MSPLPETVDSALARRVVELLLADAILMAYLKGIEGCELDQLLDYRGVGALPRLFVSIDGFGQEILQPINKTGLVLSLVSSPERATSLEFNRVRAFGRIFKVLLEAGETHQLDVQPVGDERQYQYALGQFQQVNLPRFLNMEKSAILTAGRLVISTHKPAFTGYQS